MSLKFIQLKSGNENSTERAINFEKEEIRKSIQIPLFKYLNGNWASAQHILISNKIIFHNR
jgi:hypothetical protein